MVVWLVADFVVDFGFWSVLWLPSSKIDGDINLPYYLPQHALFVGISTGMVSHILGITYT
jgi:hypothetical protein